MQLAFHAWGPLLCLLHCGCTLLMQSLAQYHLLLLTHACCRHYQVLWPASALLRCSAVLVNVTAALLAPRTCAESPDLHVIDDGQPALFLQSTNNRGT